MNIFPALLHEFEGDIELFSVTKATPNTPPYRAAPTSTLACNYHVKCISSLVEGSSDLQKHHSLIGHFAEVNGEACDVEKEHTFVRRESQRGKSSYMVCSFVLPKL